jgi:hypothetical protein
MSANNVKIRSLIETAFGKALENLSNEKDGALISDLYVQVDRESGELSIFDDAEKEIKKIVLYDWIKSQEEESVFTKKVASSVKAALTTLSSKGTFDDIRFVKPFSVSLTDDDFVVIEELLFIDDELFRLDDPLLKDLDKELDEFLKNLLSDVE